MRQGWLRHLMLGLAFAVSTAAWAQTTPAAPAAATSATPAPAAAAVPEPKPGDTNAQRAISQPGNNAPFWRAVRESGNQQGITSLPGAEKGMLVQPFVQYPGSRLTTAGEAWRQVRNQWLIPYGGSLLLIVLLAVGIFYKTRGPLGGHEPDTGRMVERFTPLERATHWTVAGTFVALAVSGIVLAFGKYFLLPVLGSTLFGWLSFLLKNIHNFVGPLFSVALVLLFITFLKDNLPRMADLDWIKRAGGMFGGSEVPSHRFNAGEKMVFWLGVCLSGLVVAGSGLVLNQVVPGMAYLRGDMQVAHMLHLASAVVMMMVLIGHMYMGSVGVKGSLVAMKTGWVDEGWAKEHHELWYDDIKAGKIPAQRSGQSSPAGAAVTPARPA